MNNLDKTYTALLQDILDNGVEKKDRTGTGTLSVFSRQIRHNMKDGFPLLTTKKMGWKQIVTELLWFLKGDTNIKYLVDNNCHIWDGDAYKNYLKKTNDWSDSGPHNITLDELDMIGKVTGSISNSKIRQYTQEEFTNKIKTDDEFAKKWGELGPIYGAQWRHWGEHLPQDPQYRLAAKPYIDQIANLINDLKTNPDSRRLMVNAWNVGEIDKMVLPPCHYGFQVYTRELSEQERWCLYGETCNRLQTPSIKGSTNKEQMEEYYKEYNIPTRAISLMWNQRSVDTFLGLPFNIASYGLLLEIIAKEVNMVPDELIGNLGDVHLYSNHIEQAKEQIGRELSLEDKCDWLTKNYPLYELGEWTIEKLSDIDYLKDVEFEYNIPTRTREPYPLPTLNINTEFWQTESGECGVGPLKTNLQGFEISDFVIENYQSHPTIKAPLSN